VGAQALYIPSEVVTARGKLVAFIIVLGKPYVSSCYIDLSTLNVNGRPYRARTLPTISRCTHSHADERLTLGCCRRACLTRKWNRRLCCLTTSRMRVLPFAFRSRRSWLRVCGAGSFNHLRVRLAMKTLHERCEPSYLPGKLTSTCIVSLAHSPFALLLEPTALRICETRACAENGDGAFMRSHAPLWIDGRWDRVK